MKPPNYFEIYRTIFLLAGVTFLMFFLFRTSGGVFTGNSTGSDPYNVSISSLGTAGAVNGSSSAYGMRLTQGMIAGNGSGGAYNVTLGWLRIGSLKAFMYVAAPTTPAGSAMNISALYRSDSPITNANCQVTTPDGTFSMTSATGGNYTYAPPSHRVTISSYNLTCSKTGYVSLSSAGTYTINGTWWDTWWRYRTSLNVTAASAANYVPVWANVSTSGHVTNCTREVRVLAQNNGSEIPSWITPNGNGAPNYCGVFFHANLTAGNQTFYVYYGNSSLDPPNYAQYSNLWLANLTLGNATFQSDDYSLALGSTIDFGKLNGTNFTIANLTQYLNSTSYFYLDNDDYNFSSGIAEFRLPVGANYSVFYNTSFGWRNITELNLTGWGNWSLASSGLNDFLNRLQLNFTLAGGNGMDFGIRDTAQGGSYWLSQSSGLNGKVNLTNDFLTAELTENDFRIWNFSSGLLYNASFSSSIKVNGVNFTGVYGSGTQNKTVYFFDWASQNWKTWQSGVSNSTHGTPNFLLPQNREAFKWRYFFNRTGWPQVNVTFLMTAHDPFVRIFVDSLNQTQGQYNITLQVSPTNSTYANLKVGGTYTEYDISLNVVPPSPDKSVFFYNRPASMANQTVLFSATNWQPSSTRNLTVSAANTTASGGFDSLNYNYSLSGSGSFLVSLGYTLPTNTSMGVGNWTLGFSSEPLERVANSTLTYYDIMDWNTTSVPGGMTKHNATLAFRYNSSYFDDFPTGGLNYTGVEDSSQFSAGTLVDNRTFGGRQHRILNLGVSQLSFNLTDHDSRTQMEYDQRKLALQVSVLTPAAVQQLAEESIGFAPSYSSIGQDTSPVAINSQVRWNVTVLQGSGLAAGTCNYTSLPSDRVAGSEKVSNVTKGENMTFSVAGNYATWTCYFNEASRYTVQFNTSAPTSSETSWAQKISSNSTAALQYINETFTITNPSSSLAYSSVQWSAANACPSRFSCSLASGTVSSIAAGSSSIHYPQGEGDLITETQTNWAQNLTANSTAVTQYINSTVSLPNNGTLDLSSIYFAPSCPADFGCTNFTYNWTVPMTGNFTAMRGEGDVIAEVQTDWAQNATRNSTVTAQYVNTTITLTPNTTAINFTNLYFAPLPCPANFACTGYPQYNWTVNVTIGNTTLFETWGDVIAEVQTDWAQNATANSTYLLQYLNTTVTLASNGTIGFTNIYYNVLGCHANFTCPQYPQYGWIVPAAGNVTYFDSSGGVITYNETAMQNVTGRTFKNITMSSTAPDLGFQNVWANTTIPDNRIYSAALRVYNGSGNDTLVDLTPANLTSTCNSTMPEFQMFNYSTVNETLVWYACKADLNNNSRADYVKWVVPHMSYWVIEAGGTLFPDGSSYCTSADQCAGGYCNSGICASSPPTVPKAPSSTGGGTGGGSSGGIGSIAPPTPSSKTYSSSEIALPATEVSAPRLLPLMQPEFADAIDYAETFATTAALAGQLEVKRSITPATLKSDIELSIRNTGTTPLRRFVVVETVSKAVAHDVSMLSDFKPRTYDRVLEYDPAVMWVFDGLPAGQNLTVSYSVSGFADVSSYLPPIISFPIFRPAYPFKAFPPTIESKLYQGEYSFVTLDFSNFLNRPLTIGLSAEGDVLDIVQFGKNAVTVGPEGTGYAQLKLYALPTASPAAYKGDILVRAEGLTTKIPVTIIVGTRSEELLDVKTEVVDKAIPPGAPVRFKLEVYNLGKTPRVDITGTYSVLDSSGTEIAGRSETLAVETSLSQLKEMALPAGTGPGKYSLQVTESYANRTATSADYFEVVEAPRPLAQMMLLPPETILGLLAALVLAAILLFALQKSGLVLFGRRYPFKISGKLPAQAGVNIGRVAETAARASFSFKALSNHMIIVGGAGSGKSMAAMAFAEEALMKEIPVVVFDPTGEWTGFVKPAKGALLRSYAKFGMKPGERRGFVENMVHVTGPSMDIGIADAVRPGEITVFCMEHLKPEDFGKFVSHGVDAILAAKFADGDNEDNDNDKMKLLVVFDGIRRFSGAGGAIERACREFRENGIGAILVSQTMADFKKSANAMAGTEVRFRTNDEGDMNVASAKYGPEFRRALPRLQTGVAMVQNSDYNGGKPWFVHFRPTLHDPGKLGSDDMARLDQLNARMLGAAESIEKLKAKGARVRDIEDDLELAREKLGRGRFAECEVYLGSVEEKMKKASGR